jgi:hypothetical protein
MDNQTLGIAAGIEDTSGEMLQSKMPEGRSLMLVFDASHSIDALFSFL